MTPRGGGGACGGGKRFQFGWARAFISAARSKADPGRARRGPDRGRGHRAALAYALIPSAENKAKVWAELTASQNPANWRNRALVMGFQHPVQVELTRPYTAKFFADADAVWAARDSEPAQEFMVLGYPVMDVSPEALRRTRSGRPKRGTQRRCGGWWPRETTGFYGR
ncbi:hypothetical protein [Catellatospora tritici]|uniref:hypothetical protein n=1 Tax=Catellatospora tritici TaxID=2851566 RepID=UPI001C2DCA63|nr:hypothetical protein [Catellatospora tritici]MBV1854117.1 hypothetical protein [Catellatospora tritici]